jgi:hypothetical protein
LPDCRSTRAIARHRALVAPLGAAAPVALTPIAIEEEGGDDVTAAVGGHGDDIPPLLRPEIRGEGGVRLRAGTVLADGAVRARFGATWQPSAAYSVSFDGTAISAPLGGGRIYASVERRHWGPSWTGSLILDAGARRSRRSAGARANRRRSGRRGSPGSGRGRSMPSPAACRRRTDRSTRTCSARACR